MPRDGWEQNAAISGYWFRFYMEAFRVFFLGEPYPVCSVAFFVAPFHMLLLLYKAYIAEESKTVVFDIQ